MGLAGLGTAVVRACTCIFTQIVSSCFTRTRCSSRSYKLIQSIGFNTRCANEQTPRLHTSTKATTKCRKQFFFSFPPSLPPCPHPIPIPTAGPRVHLSPDRCSSRSVSAILQSFSLAYPCIAWLNPSVFDFRPALGTSSLRVCRAPFMSPVMAKPSTTAL